MATVNPFTVAPSPVPDGSTGEIDLTFQTAPSTPDKTASIQVLSNGAVEQSGTALLKGHPAEATPTVLVGSTDSGWEIRTDQGTLAALGNNKFTIHY